MRKKQIFASEKTGLTFSSLERSSGRKVECCSLSTNRRAAHTNAHGILASAAHTRAARAREEKTRNPDFGWWTSPLQEMQGHEALCTNGCKRMFSLQGHTSVQGESAQRLRAGGARACLKKRGSSTCKEVALAGAIETDDAVMLITERSADGLLAVGLEAVDAHLLDVHLAVRRAGRRKSANLAEESAKSQRALRARKRGLQPATCRHPASESIQPRSPTPVCSGAAAPMGKEPMRACPPSSRGRRAEGMAPRCMRESRRTHRETSAAQTLQEHAPSARAPRSSAAAGCAPPGGKPVGLAG